MGSIAFSIVLTICAVMCFFWQNHPLSGVACKIPPGSTFRCEWLAESADRGPVRDHLQSPELPGCLGYVPHLAVLYSLVRPSDLLT